MSVTIGQWQLTMIISIRNVPRPIRPRPAGHPAPAAEPVRRALLLQDVEADRARWWADAFLTSPARLPR